MSDNKFTNKVLTYKDHEMLFHDPYHVMSYQRDARKNVFLTNPYKKDDEPFLYLAFDDEDVVGRCYFFPTLFKVGENVMKALSASSLYVVPEFRKYSLGVDIIIYGTFQESYKCRIYAGISPMALPIYKKMGYVTLEMPRYILRRNIKSFLQSKGLNSFCSSFLSPFLNVLLNARYYWFGQTKKLKKKFQINELFDVPEWIEDLVNQDGSRYMEFHNREWFQWQLCGSFSNGFYDKQKLFGVYDNQSNPVGFFLIKERKNKNNGLFVGGIYEWGSIDEQILSESDIYQLAISSFNNGVYLIEIGTINKETVRECEKIGFLHNGSEHFLFKSNEIKMDGIEDIRNWRVRLGYADTIFS